LGFYSGSSEGHQFLPVDSRDPGAEFAPANSDARHTLEGFGSVGGC
jgi:hypothetical protein